MTESQLLTEFSRQVKATFIHGLRWDKLKDTFGGHKKPCDVIASYYGRSYYFEFKKATGPITNLDSVRQKEELLQIYQSENNAYVCTFIKSEKHHRNLIIIPIVNGQLDMQYSICIFWKNGEYVDIHTLFDNLYSIAR